MLPQSADKLEWTPYCTNRIIDGYPWKLMRPHIFGLIFCSLSKREKNRFRNPWSDISVSYSLARCAWQVSIQICLARHGGFCVSQEPFVLAFCHHIITVLPQYIWSSYYHHISIIMSLYCHHMINKILPYFFGFAQKTGGNAVCQMFALAAVQIS